MEFCDAGSLAAMMSKQGRALEERHIASVMKQMVEGLAYLHQEKMIHRDIKADNILMNSEGAAKLGTRVHAVARSSSVSLIGFREQPISE